MSRRGAVDAFIVMDVMEAAARAEAAGRHIVHMEIGQPATPAPEGARDAVAAAMAAGPLGYTGALGLPALRRRIARHYGDRHGVDLDPGRVIVTAGASAAFVLAFTALFDGGDRVASGLPGYPSYRRILNALDLVPVGIETRAEDRWQPRPDALPDGIAGLIIASPGNPAGTVLHRPDLAALLDAAAGRGAAVIADEIYQGIDHGDPPPSALALSDEVYAVNSFSKYWSMTGWRVGWMVVPSTHVRTVERLAQNMFICPPNASQVAALAAMDCDAELSRAVSVYGANRRIVCDGLRAMGLTGFVEPEGAFYVYVDVSHLTDDSVALAARILDEAGVAVTPGVDFDPVRGGGTLRLSFAAATDEIGLGMQRLARFIATLD